MSDADKTPVDRPVWNMHPRDVTITVPETGTNQRVLEQILETVTGVLNESRDIKVAAQKSCDLALRAYEQIPKLNRRVTILELVVLVTTVVNVCAAVFRHG
jgi:hypothetical protein